MEEFLAGMLAEEFLQCPRVAFLRFFFPDQFEVAFILLLPFADRKGLVGIDRLSTRRGSKADVLLKRCLIFHWNGPCFYELRAFLLDFDEHDWSWRFHSVIAEKHWLDQPLQDTDMRVSGKIVPLMFFVLASYGRKVKRF